MYWRRDGHNYHLGTNLGHVAISCRYYPFVMSLSKGPFAEGWFDKLTTNAFGGECTADCEAFGPTKDASRRDSRWNRSLGRTDGYNTYF